MRTLFVAALVLVANAANAACPVTKYRHGVWMFDCANQEFAQALSEWRVENPNLDFAVVPQTGKGGVTNRNIVHVLMR